MKKLASGLVSVAIAIVVPGGFIILLYYYLSKYWNCSFLPRKVKMEE